MQNKLDRASSAASHGPLRCHPRACLGRSRQSPIMETESKRREVKPQTRNPRSRPIQGVGAAKVEPVRFRKRPATLIAPSKLNASCGKHERHQRLLGRADRQLLPFARKVSSEWPAIQDSVV
jgi:hypothetical protein